LLSALLIADSALAEKGVGGGPAPLPNAVGEKYGKEISVLDFGASPSATAADNVTAFQAALDRAKAMGGGRIHIPHGVYALNASLSIPANTMLQGDGRKASVLRFGHAGDGIRSTWPINSSTAATVGLRDLGIVNDSGKNAGSGFVDVGGSFVDLSNVFLSGWKYQVTLDQTEIATIDASEIIQASPGQTGIWLVNGADHSAGAREGFTNRITISRSQFNASKSAGYNILDDGGVSHSIRDNNFNAGYGGIRAAGVAGLDFEGNESEGHEVPAQLSDKTLAGKYVGPCLAPLIRGNVFSDIADVHVSVDSASGGSIAENVFAQATLANVSFNGEPDTKAVGLIVEGNTKLIRGSYKQAAPFVRGAASAFKLNQVRQAAATYGWPVRETAKPVEVRPGTMEGIYPNSRLLVVNEDGSNAETIIVTDTTPTSFTAVFQSAKNDGFSVFGTAPIAGSRQ
jgi:hypothetical protein